MSNAEYRFIKRAVILVLIVTLLVPAQTNARATPIEPRASDYLNSYNTYICPMALGKIEIWYSVTGVNYMDEIGVLTIQLYESTDNVNWTWVKTFKHATTSGMLAYDTIYHSNHVDYSGTIGRYYKAYVTIWAGKDGDGDTRYMWTLPKKASLLPG